MAKTATHSQAGQTQPQDLLAENAGILLLCLLRKVTSFPKLSAFRRQYGGIIPLLPEDQRKAFWAAFRDKETSLRKNPFYKQQQARIFKQNLQQTADLVNRRNHNG